MREIHKGSCGNHSSGNFLPTLVKDSKELVKKCESCQKYASLIHQPADLNGADQNSLSVRPVENRHRGTFPPAQAQKKFIIVAVEYFSKWVEAEAVAKISEREVISFIWKNI
ncbi:UNVERIFIED_CONTAM: hypothetical protein Sindi_1996900, partial [Sesamum indicum]